MDGYGDDASDQGEQGAQEGRRAPEAEAAGALACRSPAGRPAALTGPPPDRAEALAASPSFTERGISRSPRTKSTSTTGAGKAKVSRQLTPVSQPESSSPVVKPPAPKKV